MCNVSSHACTAQCAIRMLPDDFWTVTHGAEEICAMYAFTYMYPGTYNGM